MSNELMLIPASTKTILSNNRDKGAIMRAMSLVTKEVALSDDAIPSMSRLRRQYGEAVIERALSYFIQDVAMSVGNKMEPAVVADCAVEILNTYPYSSLKLEEIYLICQEIKQNDTYGKLTPAKMLRAVAKFWKDREQRAINQQIDASQRDKDSSDLDARLRNSVREPEQLNNTIARLRAGNQKYLK